MTNAALNSKPSLKSTRAQPIQSPPLRLMPAPQARPITRAENKAQRQVEKKLKQQRKRDELCEKYNSGDFSVNSRFNRLAITSFLAAIIWECRGILQSIRALTPDHDNVHIIMAAASIVLLFGAIAATLAAIHAAWWYNRTAKTFWLILSIVFLPYGAEWIASRGSAMWLVDWIGTCTTRSSLIACNEEQIEIKVATAAFATITIISLNIFAILKAKEEFLPDIWEYPTPSYSYIYPTDYTEGSQSDNQKGAIFHNILD